MLTTREAFKAGFLLKCADLGLSGKEATECIQKATELLTKQAFMGQDTLSGFAGSTLGMGRNLGTMAAISLPVALGGAAGYLANEAVSPEVDEEDVKKQEIIDELNHYARRAREKQQSKTLRHG